MSMIEDITSFRREGSGKVRFLFAVLPVSILFLFFMGLSSGSVHIGFKDLAAVFTGADGADPVYRDIIFGLRLPRMVAAMLTGAALGVGGLLMQTLFMNPLAGPFVLGINAGASLGVAIVILFAGASGFGAFGGGLSILSEMGMVMSATAGAAVVICLVLVVAGRIANKTVLLLVGIMFSYAVSALVSVLIHFSMADRIQSFLSWTYGSFSTVSGRELAVMVPIITISLCLVFPLGKQLNALLLGETYASSMGVPVKRVRYSVIFLTSLLAATVTAFCGPVAFLGIAVPHVGRNIAGTGDHRILIPLCILIGALAALASDMVAHLPGGGVVLPLNAVTSLIGAPVVIWIISRYQHVGR